MKTIKFDLMCEDRFVKTFKMDVHPLFPVTDEEMREFVIKRLPTYKNKQLEFHLYEEKEDDKKQSVTIR